MSTDWKISEIFRATAVSSRGDFGGLPAWLDQELIQAASVLKTSLFCGDFSNRRLGFGPDVMISSSSAAAWQGDKP
jgi:hypothetical protein